jgi:acetyltransferase-like isoleucine patch superfamily enzyme
MYYSIKQLLKLGVNICGNNIKISKQTKIINPQNLFLKDNIRIDDYCLISAHGKINIGNYVHISRNCFLISSTNNMIKLSDFSGLSNNCSLFGQSDNYDGTTLTNPTIPKIYTNIISGNIILEKHVIIGSTSIILPNTYINEGSSVGCLSVVNGTLDPWRIYAGNPLKNIKERKKDILYIEEQLLSLNKHFNIL